MTTQPSIFDGPDLTADDTPRLTRQIERVYHAMLDHQWRTLDDIVALTGDPHSSISAQLRHLRKPRFGGHTVERASLGYGLYTYRLTAAPCGLLDGSEAPAPANRCPMCGRT